MGQEPTCAGRVAQIGASGVEGIDEAPADAVVGPKSAMKIDPNSKFPLG